jgi:hypothetical protein
LLAIGALWTAKETRQLAKASKKQIEALQTQMQRDDEREVKREAAAHKEWLRDQYGQILYSAERLRLASKQLAKSEPIPGDHRSLSSRIESEIRSSADAAIDIGVRTFGALLMDQQTLDVSGDFDALVLHFRVLEIDVFAQDLDTGDNFEKKRADIAETLGRLDRDIDSLVQGVRCYAAETGIGQMPASPN